MQSAAADRRRRWRKRCLGWAAVGAYAAFLAYLSLRPVDNSPLDRVIAGVGRAYLHVPAYAALAVLLGAVYASSSAAKRAAIGLIAAVAYGWLLELAQIPAPTRFFNVLGLALDVAGAAAGAATIFLGSAVRQRRRRRLSGPSPRRREGEG